MNDGKTGLKWLIIIIAIIAVLIFRGIRIIGGKAESSVEYYYPLGTDLAVVTEELNAKGIAYDQHKIGSVIQIAFKGVSHNLIGDKDVEVIYIFNSDNHRMRGVNIFTYVENADHNDVMRRYRNSVATLRKMMGKPRYAETIKVDKECTVYAVIWDTFDGEVFVYWSEDGILQIRSDTIDEIQHNWRVFGYIK